MKPSKYITSITLNDNHNPGQIITLNVHQIDGGYIGIDSNFTEEVANYIINPYVEDDMVQIVDPENFGESLDPPLEDDTILQSLRVLIAMDEVLQSQKSLDRLEFKTKVSQSLRITLDEYEIAIGTAQLFLSKSQDKQ